MYHSQGCSINFYRPSGGYVDRTHRPQVWVRIEDSTADWSDECKAFPQERWLEPNVFTLDSTTSFCEEQIGCKIMKEDFIPPGEGENFALAFEVTNRRWNDYAMRLIIGNPPKGLRNDESIAAAQIEFAKRLLAKSFWSTEAESHWERRKAVHAQAVRTAITSVDLTIKAWSMLYKDQRCHRGDGDGTAGLRFEFFAPFTLS